MKGLAVQVLAAILLFVSLSYSQEDWEGQKFPKYAVVDKQINVREIIRFGGREHEVQNGGGESEIPEEAGSRGFSASSLLTMLSNAAKIRKVKNMLPLSGMQWIKKDDIGEAINCGPNGSHLVVTWNPRIIDPQTSVKVAFDIVNPIDFDKGKAHVDVYMEDSPDPIFSVDQDIACQDIAKQLPLFSCPMRKGHREKAQFTYSDLSKLPTGSYTIVLSIFSYNGTAKSPPLFGCLNMTLKIVPSANRNVHPFPQVIV